MILESMKMEMPVEAEDRARSPRSAARRARPSPRATSSSCSSRWRRSPAASCASTSRPTTSSASRSTPGQAQRARPRRSSTRSRERSPRLDARCLVITGTGRDVLRRLRHRRRSRRTTSARGRGDRRPPVRVGDRRARRHPYPTLAALNGHTIGGGLELALSATCASQADARLGMPPARLGLIYSHTGLRKFIQAIGAPAHARAVPPRPQRRRRGGAGVGPRRRVVPRRGRGARSSSPRDRRQRAAVGPGNKRVIRELLAAEGALDPAVEASSSRCATPASPRRTSRGRAGASGKRAPRWQGRDDGRRQTGGVRRLGAVLPRPRPRARARGAPDRPDR